MKTPAKVLVAVCVFAFATMTANGQITVTAANVAAVFAAGKSIVTNNDTTTTSINIGVLGSTSWDFSALHSHTPTTLVSIAPGSSPYAANFPGATHVLTAPVTFLGIVGTGYQYLSIGPNLLNLGSEAGFLLGGLGSADGKILNSPIEELYALPSTLGTSWTSSFTASTNITVNGFPYSSSATSHNYSYVVDAYGLMKMPGGTFSDALRIKRVDNVAAKTVSYIFLSTDGALVQLTAADTLQASSGTISVSRKSITWTAPDPALPIQLASFSATAKPNGEGIMLNWSTASEIENYGFNVQRRPGTTGEFSQVAGSFVPGHGTTSQSWTYSFVDAAPPAGNVQYRLEQIDLDGSRHYTEPVQVNSVTGVAAEVPPPSFRLEQNYPNPFNPSTTIQLRIENSEFINLRVYDLLGREVAVLVNGRMEGGVHRVTFDAGNLPGGVYLCRMETPSKSEVIRMVLLR